MVDNVADDGGQPNSDRQAKRRETIPELLFSRLTFCHYGTQTSKSNEDDNGGNAECSVDPHMGNISKNSYDGNVRRTSCTYTAQAKQNRKLRHHHFDACGCSKCIDSYWGDETDQPAKLQCPKHETNKASKNGYAMRDFLGGVHSDPKF